MASMGPSRNTLQNKGQEASAEASKATRNKERNVAAADAGRRARQAVTRGGPLHKMGQQVGVGDAGGASDLQSREELIVALNDVVKTQGQQLVVKEEEIQELRERLRSFGDEEETVFALVDTVEKAEADLLAAKKTTADVRAECAVQQQRVATLEAQVASLRWQLRIAVPDAAMRQILVEQAELAIEQGWPLLMSPSRADGENSSSSGGDGGGGGPETARKLAQKDADHRRTFLTAARELNRLQSEMESLRDREDAMGSWGRRVDAIWGNVSSLSAEIQRRRSGLEQREVILRQQVSSQAQHVATGSTHSGAAALETTTAVGLSSSKGLSPMLDPLSKLDGGGTAHERVGGSRTV